MIAWALFVGFGRVGLLGFGGGPSMLPLMQAECIGAHWLTEEQFLEGLAIGNALPGPISTKMAVFVGWKVGGALGALSAFLGVTLPSVFLMSLFGALLMEHRENRWVVAAIRGAKPAVVGMLFWVAMVLAPAGVQGARSGALAIAAFVALWSGLHPAVVMVVSVGAGLAFFS